MRRFVTVIEWTVIGLMGIIAATVIVEVLIRDFLDRSLGVHEELTRYLMIWVAMLGSVLLTHDDGHIRIAIIPDALNPKIAAAVGILADMIVVFFLSVFVFSSAINLPSIAGQNTITLGVGMIWFHAALPVGGALMLLISLYNLAMHLRQAFSNPR